MTEHKMPASGTFCWTELATTDVGAAGKFYSALLGWRLHSSEAAGAGYTEIEAGGERIGGIHQMGEEFGQMPSHWMAYVAVEDVDEKARLVAELGGTVCVPPCDIPNVGRFCVVNDPTGATLSLITLTGAHS
ncbi:MAG TPA: VOC family protein [Pyrinomonadaceae bacterium]|nr:VOC family protein [Pyrinomonadaceae bacterium]